MSSRHGTIIYIHGSRLVSTQQKFLMLQQVKKSQGLQDNAVCGASVA